MLVYLNGRYLPRDEARLSPDDRGFIFGDGVYEVYLVVDGRLFEAERHDARLAAGLAALRIAPPADASPEGVAAIGARLLAEAGLGEGLATLYVQVTRGAAPRTHYFPPAGTPPTMYAFVAPLRPLDEQRARGVAIVTQPDVRWLRCDLKTIQLLPNVLGKQAAVEAGAFDAVFVGADGVVSEGTHTNLFAVVDGTLRTHPATTRILRGVTRDVVLELAAELGIPVREAPLGVAELRGAEEAFLTGTTSDVLPVVRVDDATIAGGRPGPVARRLQDAYVARLRGAAADRSAARAPAPRA